MVDRLKNWLLVVLLVIMAGLLGMTMLMNMQNSRGGEQLMQVLDPRESSGTHVDAIAAAYPEKLAVLQENGVFYAVNGEDYALLYEQIRPLFQEALGSASEPKSITEAEYRELLQAPALLIAYHSPQPLYLLQAWSGGEVFWEDLTVRSVLLTEKAQTAVLLLTDEKGGRWETGTAASLADLKTICEKRESNASLAGRRYSMLSCEELLTDTVVSLPEYAVQKPDFVQKGELSQNILSLLSMNAYLTRVYRNSDGSLVYVESHSTLSTDPEGNLTYSSTQGASLELAETEESARRVEICQKVSSLLQQLWKETGASGQLSLEEISYNGADTCTLRFGLMADGRFAEREGDWAQVTVRRGAVVGVFAALRKMEPAEQMLLLPMQQAAAALAPGTARLCIRLMQEEDSLVPRICRVTED